MHLQFWHDCDLAVDNLGAPCVLTVGRHGFQVGWSGFVLTCNVLEWWMTLHALSCCLCSVFLPVQGRPTMCGHADALCPSKHLPGQLDRVPIVWRTSAESARWPICRTLLAKIIIFLSLTRPRIPACWYGNLTLRFALDETHICVVLFAVEEHPCSGGHCYLRVHCVGNAV